MKELIEKVIQWGLDKGILGFDGKGTIEGQSKKMIEEANETLVAVSQLTTFKRLLEKHGINDHPVSSLSFKHEDVYDKIREEAEDGIGDTMVTLILLCEMLGFDLENCLQQAYNVISKRTGKMVDGTFVKDN